jgi:hypothetical protein
MESAALMVETQRQKQSRFALGVALLIQEADARGYAVTLGEAWRTPEQAKWNAAQGIGTVTSLHIERLAIDLNLFKDGVFITDGTGHTELGAWWKALGEDHRWGGDFQKKDYNHYSITPDGRRA